MAYLFIRPGKTISALLQDEAPNLFPLFDRRGDFPAGAATEQEIVDQSAAIARAFRQIPEKEIPRGVSHGARGLAVIRVVKVGFGFSGKGGQAVQAFSRDGNVTLGADLSAAAGWAGRARLVGGCDAARSGLHLQQEQGSLRRRFIGRRDHRHTKNGQRLLLRTVGERGPRSFRVSPPAGANRLRAALH
ncbi:MAG: hypothetical protein M3Y03_02435 [Verrucomicrobiota bacterium]|nr:hypothetical protein [Verrucomicrobiota bacterium]